LIPAIESGWLEQIHCFGSEVGMDDYMTARSDIFFTGHDGSLRPNRMICQTVGLYACDMFIGPTLQIDLAGNGSVDRVVGLGERRGFRLRSQAPGLRRGSSLWVVFVLPYFYGVVRMQPAVRRAANAPIDDVRTWGDRMPAIESAIEGELAASGCLVG
jgi:hypothetical protein